MFISMFRSLKVIARGDAPSRARHTRTRRLFCEPLEERNLLTAGVTNLGLATHQNQFDGDLLAFAIPESGQGNTDLNGDGDTLDSVVHVYDASSGTTTNLGLESGSNRGSNRGQLLTLDTLLRYRSARYGTPDPSRV